jgi:hypothetical protein
MCTSTVHQVKNLTSKILLFILDTFTKILTFQKKTQSSIKFDEFSGLWKNYDVSIKTIREKAWK